MENGMFELLKTATILVGIIVILLAVLLIFLAVRGFKKGKRKKLFNFSAAGITALSLVIIIAANILTSMYSSSIDSNMAVTPRNADETNKEEWKDLEYSIAEEGMVLLENKNNVLPLQNTDKVNLLGYFGYNPIYSGTGSGYVEAEDPCDIITSLNEVGIEVNPALAESEIYKTAEQEVQWYTMILPNFELHEPAIEAYSGDISFENMKEYSDTAIVVLGRRGAETADMPEGCLHITQEEEDLLSTACDNFEKVIVLINSANIFEMDWKNKYDVDAIVWTGLPGPYGFKALGEILKGEINPSGKLPDTWVYDHDSNPTSENFGEQEAENAEGRYYVDYVEGIYLGYKWYETAYAENAVITNTKTGETFDYSDYESIVAYPFGYGLSYTSFSQEISGGTLVESDALDPTETYTVEVTVENTGTTEGRSAVQLYVTVPYTQYDIEKKIEKSEVSLAGYGKTDPLNPGESEVVTIELSMEDIASYDSSYDNGDGTTGAYMLDAGEYEFTLRSDSHTVIDSVTSNLNDQHYYSGEEKRSSDVKAAVNEFEEAARGEYLSRQNGFANYESAMQSVVPEVKSVDYVNMKNEYDPTYDDVVDGTYEEGVDYASDGNLTLEDMKGLDYDDPKWDQFISQMTIDELLLLTGKTMYASPVIESVEKPATVDADGPLGLSCLMRQATFDSVSFPCVPLLTATFNTDLAYDMGSSIAEMAKLNGVTIWYAPAMNMHRSAYSGRNYEYYSEDALLSAKTAAAETLGARDNEVIVYIKHCALNDMESKRSYIHVYSNEQAIREIYLKPFEHAVKYGDANGVMTSQNYIGDIYAGGHVGLLTDVIRGEWGFVGMVMTDMDEANEFNDTFWTNIRAGLDVWLAMGDSEIEPESDADIYYLQRAAHNQLYTYANNNIQEVTILDWRGQALIIYVELGILAAAGIASLIIRNKKKVK